MLRKNGRKKCRLYPWDCWLCKNAASKQKWFLFFFKSSVRTKVVSKQAFPNWGRLDSASCPGHSEDLINATCNLSSLVHCFNKCKQMGDRKGEQGVWAPTMFQGEVHDTRNSRHFTPFSFFSIMYIIFKIVLSAWHGVDEVSFISFQLVASQYYTCVAPPFTTS